MARGSEMESFCKWEDDTLVLNILGRPRAKRTKIGKVKGKQLEIAVAADPVRGRRPRTWWISWPMSSG